MRPRVAVHDANGALSPRINRLLSAEWTVAVYRVWRSFTADVTEACAGVVVSGRADPVHVGDISLLTQGNPTVPIVVVAKDPVVACRLARIRLGGLVWASRVDRELVSALRDAIMALDAYDVVAAIRNASWASPLLRQALLQCLHESEPIHSVAALARTLHVTPRTLQAHWREARSTRAELRLKDAVDWFVLLHATRRRRALDSWRVAAHLSGTTQKRLRRIARRLLGLTLDEVEARGVDAVTRPLVVGLLDGGPI